MRPTSHIQRFPVLFVDALLPCNFSYLSNGTQVSQNSSFIVLIDLEIFSNMQKCRASLRATRHTRELTNTALDHPTILCFTISDTARAICQSVNGFTEVSGVESHLSQLEAFLGLVCVPSLFCPLLLVLPLKPNSHSKAPD